MVSIHSNLDVIRKCLDAHRPVDGSECESLRRILTLVSSARHPFARDSFHPGHLTASGIVVNEDLSRTMLIFHEKLQRWLQPGGHFEPGESDPSIAAAREVFEETGLKTEWPGEAPILLDVDVHPIPARKTDPAHCHFDLRMLLIADDEKGAAGDGVSDAQWLSSSELKDMDLDPGLTRALRKIGL